VELDVRELSELAEFSKTESVRKILYETRAFNVVLVCLETGQEISPHPESYDVCFYVIDGEGTFTVGDRQIDLNKGSMIFAPENITRGMKSKERLTLLGIQEPH